MSFNAPAKARTVHYRMLYPQVLRSSPPTPVSYRCGRLKLFDTPMREISRVSASPRKQDSIPARRRDG
jgi:hypothetical protein